MGGCLTSPKLTASPSSHSRFVGPEEEDLVLIGGGFDCSFWHLINLGDTKGRVRGEARDPWGSSDPRTSPQPFQGPVDGHSPGKENSLGIPSQSGESLAGSAQQHKGVPRAVGASRAPLLTKL